MRKVQKMFPGWCQTKIAIIHGVALSASCVVSYWLITHIFGRSIAVSRERRFSGRHLGDNCNAVCVSVELMSKHWCRVVAHDLDSN